MVKKLILSLVSTNDETIIINDNELLIENKKLHELLTSHKNQITSYYNDKSWDKFKKLSNEYELIFTTPNTGINISKYIPVSRSFFKLWEILHDFHDEIFIEQDMKCLFLADGPGSFIESFLKYRSSYKDQLYGMTLISNNNKSIPDWKISHERLTLTYGEDGTGNLYNFSNILYLIKLIGKNILDFITSDGGFDFSIDFNNQEELSMRLILAEILSAVCLQKVGGKFILKIFDIFNIETLKIIHLLKEFYENIYLIKPLSSRPSNSEKYILCTGFTINKQNEHYKNLLIHVIKNYNQENQNRFFNEISFNNNLLRNIILYNSYYCLRQIYYIQKTINYINKYKIFTDETRDILAKNKKKCIKWCQKYQLEYNL
jgi:23S rRNA U2552 (ribose-2'-O)-methylase RlmE/FtsJ